MVSVRTTLGRLVRGVFVVAFFLLAVAFSTAVLGPLWFFALLFGNEFLGLTYPVVEVGVMAAVGAATGVGELPLVVGDVPLLYPAALALTTALYLSNPFTVSVGGSSESGISVGGVHLEYETDLDDGAEGGDFGDGGDFGGGFDGGGGGGGE